VLAPDLSSNCYSILDGFKYPPLQISNTVRHLRNLFLFAASSFFLGIGQFTRLLPSVEVVAVSQAPSPESNPNPPLPSTPWQSTTRPSLADRAVVHRKTPVNRLSHGMNWVNTACVAAIAGVGSNSTHSQDVSLPTPAGANVQHLVESTL
jgi:hypothetical protein